MSLTLTSPAFENGGVMPAKYSCDGAGVSPELHISGVPEGARSLVLLVQDPDIPQAVKDRIGQHSFDHWVLYTIPPETTIIPEGDIPVGAFEGRNSAGEVGYRPACPPDGSHRYIFTLYALNRKLAFSQPVPLAEVEKAIANEDGVLEKTELIGTYKRVVQ